MLVGFSGQVADASEIYGVYPDKYSQMPKYIQIEVDRLVSQCRDWDQSGRKLWFRRGEERIVKVPDGVFYQVEFSVIGMSSFYFVEVFRPHGSRSLQEYRLDCPFGPKD